MAESEKVTALKKAYADVILNTTKEAAARVMASESKARRYQQELFAAKDEALRLLLRLKQITDSKMKEAEATSLIQQRRIDELEAQLGEAEDIVKDLRTDLWKLQDELEKSHKSKSNHMDEHQSEEDNPSCAAISTSVSTTSSLHLAHEEKSPVAQEMTKRRHGLCEPNLATTVVGNKELGMCQNGCADAFESNPHGENESLPELGRSENGETITAEDESNQRYKKLENVVDSSFRNGKCSGPVSGVNHGRIGIARVSCRKRKRDMAFKKNKHAAKRVNGKIKNVVEEIPLDADAQQTGEALNETAASCKFHKFTFQRKHKDFSCGESKLTEMPRHGLHDSHNGSLVTESTRDGQKLAQVV